MAAPDKLQAIRDAGAALVTLGGVDAFEVAPKADYELHNEELSARHREHENNVLLSGGLLEGLGRANAFLDRKRADQADRRSSEDQRKDSTALLLLINEIQDQLTELTAEYQRYDEAGNALDDFIAALESGEAPELNEDGSLKNEKAEALIREYEEKFGVAVDRTDPEALKAVAEYIKEKKNELAQEVDEQNAVKEKATEMLTPHMREASGVVALLENDTLDPVVVDKALQEIDPEEIAAASELLIAEANDSERAVEEALAADGFDLFVDEPIGSENAFIRGEASSEFNAVSTPPSIEPSPSNDGLTIPSPTNTTL